MYHTDLTQEVLKETVHYDKDTGIFTSKTKKRGKLIGTVCGHKERNGYIRIMINYHHYFAHRLVWLYIHGVWPTQLIDHINGCRTDNRLLNLREATCSENRKNSRYLKNKTGFRGVSKQNSASNPYYSMIRVNGKKKLLGYFKTAEDAHQAYVDACHKHHGKFSPYC